MVSYLQTNATFYLFLIANLRKTKVAKNTHTQKKQITQHKHKHNCISYNPTHFDCCDLAIHSLGELIHAKAFESPKRQCRDIIFYFDGSKKRNEFIEFIISKTKHNKILFGLNNDIVNIISQYMFYNNDKLIIRCYQSVWAHPSALQKNNENNNNNNNNNNPEYNATDMVKAYVYRNVIVQRKPCIVTRVRTKHKFYA